MLFCMSRSSYLPRHLDAPLGRALASAAVVILDGPRGAGKTTTAARMATTTVMLPRDLGALSADAETYLRAVRPPVLVDEWQLAGTELLWVVKRIVDDDPTPGRFILTGSVEPATYGATYPLTGRAVRLVMRPMSWAELEGRGDEPPFVRRTLDGDPPPIGSGVSDPFELATLFRAGFPAARDMDDPSLFLDAYASLVSHRAGEEGRDASRLLRTLRVLATLSGQATPDQRVWEAADITKPTLKQYDDLLLRVHISTPTPAFQSNHLKRLTDYPKRFLADTALALALSDLSEDDLRADPTVAGHYLESFVAQQLRPQADLVGGALVHLRTGGGDREVDAVIEVGNRLVGFEVKLGRRPGRSDARPLEWLREQLGDPFTRGFVVHTGTDCYPLGERILALPLGLLVGGKGDTGPEE